MKTTMLALTAAGASLLSSAVFAADDTDRFSLSIEGGVEYDSNITVDAQDLTTNRGDMAFLIEGEAGYTIGDIDTLEVEARYDFYQSLYLDLTDFDMQIHGLSLTASRDVHGVDASGTYRFSHILLGGDGFLDIHSFNPTIGMMIGDSLYVITGYDYQDKDFDTADNRDADQHSFSIMGYYFFGSGRYVNFGYKLAKEDARASEFDYWGHYFDAGLKLPAVLGAMTSIWRLSYRYYRKDYSDVTPSIAEERLDKRHDVRTSLTFPLGDNLELKAQYRYLSARSNLPTVDYNEHIVTGMATWSF
ncbi:MAG: DUF560 domain-containing protein [Alphaproteobacteria bacterium]|nr:MAG: DUF560 domain-containing protein [Alphaproteobacteria bacterium]